MPLIGFCFERCVYIGWYYCMRLWKLWLREPCWRRYFTGVIVAPLSLFSMVLGFSSVMGTCHHNVLTKYLEPRNLEMNSLKS